MKVVFKHNSNLFVFTFGTSLNAKIAGNGELIGQHFTFSRQQFELAKGSPSMSDFFRADGTNCLDCPFSGNQSDKAGLCYTHKFGQFRGFLSSLRSIHRLHTWESKGLIALAIPLTVLLTTPANEETFIVKAWKSVEVETKPENRTDIEKKRVGSVAKLKALGWQPLYSLSKGIEKTYEWISYLNGQK